VIVAVVRIGHDKACSLVGCEIRCGTDRVKLGIGVAKMLFLLSCIDQDEGEAGRFAPPVRVCDIQPNG
jgi:hypothetical protein